MRESFDDVEINPACPKCGQGHRKTVRWLREEGSFNCIICGTRISMKMHPSVARCETLSRSAKN